jgi:hypothetical protein
MKLETIFAEIDISLLMMFVWMGVVTCKKKKKKTLQYQNQFKIFRWREGKDSKWVKYFIPVMFWEKVYFLLIKPDILYLKNMKKSI